jgi:hypothetical protein
MTAFDFIGTDGQRFCSFAGHGAVVRGQRELRGERRGKGERSLATAATSPFFVAARAVICALVAAGAPATAVAAQAVSFELRAGVAASSALADDIVASPRLAQRLGSSFEGDVKAVPALGPVIGATARTQLRPRIRAELGVGWTFATLRAREHSGDRDIQDVGVAQATLGIRYQVTPVLDVGGAFGGIRYFADDRALFVEGGDLYPMIELAGALTTPLLDGRLALHAAGQIHQFGLPVLRQAGGEDGVVMRAMVQAGIVLGKRQP